MEKSIVERLYEYLKEKYGIQGTETSKEELNIPLYTKISVPDVAKNSGEHTWVAFLEKQNSDKINALIIGQNWKDNHCSWSRYVEVKNNDSNIGFAWFQITDNTHLGDNYDFKSLIIFIKVLEDFSATI